MHGVIGDGETLGLDEGAGLGGDVVELVWRSVVFGIGLSVDAGSGGESEHRTVKLAKAAASCQLLAQSAGVGGVRCWADPDKNA